MGGDVPGSEKLGLPITTATEGVAVFSRSGETCGSTDTAAGDTDHEELQKGLSGGGLLSHVSVDHCYHRPPSALATGRWVSVACYHIW